MDRHSEFTERVRTMMRLRGYWKGDRPDVGRFCREKGYLPQSVYAWLRGVEPKHESLRRLAADLTCNVEWLMTGRGEEAELRKAAGGGGAGSARVAKAAEGARPPQGPIFQVLDGGLAKRLREVTERLDRLEAALQAFFEAYPDLVLWLDNEGTILSANFGKDFEPIIPLEQQIGRKNWEFLPPDLGRLWKEAFARVRASGRPEQFEDRLTVKGKLRIREARLAPIRGHGYLALIRDVTELRELQQRAAPAAAAAAGKEGKEK